MDIEQAENNKPNGRAIRFDEILAERLRQDDTFRETLSGLKKKSESKEWYAYLLDVLDRKTEAEGILAAFPRKAIGVTGDDIIWTRKTHCYNFRVWVYLGQLPGVIHSFR